MATGVSVRTLTRTLCVPATSHHYRAVPTWIKTLFLYSRHRRCGGTVEALKGGGARGWLRIEENGAVAAGSVEWSLGGSTAQDPRQEAQENKCYQDR